MSKPKKKSPPRPPAKKAKKKPTLAAAEKAYKAARAEHVAHNRMLMGKPGKFTAAERRENARLQAVASKRGRDVEDALQAVAREVAAKKDAKAGKKKSAKKPAKRKPSVSRGGCAAAQMKYGRSYKEADKDCEADVSDRAAFGEAGGEASKAARELAAKSKKKQLKVVGGRTVRS